MGLGLSNALNSSRLSLFSQQDNINLIGNNVANVNTPGYSRQVGVIETTEPLATRPGMMGTGVVTSRIISLYDRFIGMQLSLEQSNVGQWSARGTALRDLERTFNEASDYGLQPVMGEFWNAWEDLANNPEGIAPRVSLVQNSRVLTSTINSMYGDLTTQKRLIGQRVETLVDQINEKTSQIAELNQRISENELKGYDANDLRDRRNLLLEELAEDVDINYFENELYQVTVLSGNGKSLVQGNMSYDMVVDYDDDRNLVVSWSNDTTPMNDFVNGGRLRGLLDAEGDVNAAMDDMNELSAALIFHVNRLHSQGYGLDGSTEELFFAPNIALETAAANGGDGVLEFDAAQGLNGIDWDTLKNYDDFEIRFTADYPGTTATGSEFVIVNTSTGEEVAADDIVVTTTTAGEIGIDFNGGYHVKISYDTGTAPRLGDVFSLSFRENAAPTMRVNEALEDPAKVAAAADLLGLPGDNGTALAIGRLQHQLTMGTSTFGEFYSSVVGRIGSLARTASSNEEHAALMAEELQIKQESVSGVSIDEEMTNLIRFQQAYSASARIITAVDELLQVVTQMV
jgi:flagellar hook-associated protein 1 FlgK